MHRRLAQMGIGFAAILCASQAMAVDWVTVASNNDDDTWQVDKDSIHRASDGLVYFSDLYDDGVRMSDNAADCQGRIIYALKDDDVVYPNWRENGEAPVAGSAGDLELQYVCANAG